MFDATMERVKAQLVVSESLDYNGLNWMEKAVVHALIDSDEARFKTVGGRRVVVSKRPSRLIQFLTMGGRS